MFELFIFDLDGTIIDIKDITWFREIQRKVYSEFGVFLPPGDDLYTALKLPLEESDEYLRGLGISEPLDYWKRLEEEDLVVRKKLLDLGFLKVYPDAMSIKDIQGKSNIAMVSNTPLSVGKLELQHVGLWECFDDVYATRYKELHSKPDPHGILRMLEHFDVAPENAIMVGDSELDVIAGTRAGVATAQLIRPHHHNYDTSVPTYTIKGIDELLTIQ